MNRLGVDHIVVLTTNKALAELVAGIQNGSGRDGTVKVVAAQGSWALRNVGGEHVYAVVDWMNLKIIGWETARPGLGAAGPIHTNRLSGPWLGDVE